jgi:hypothetical protein
MTLITLQDGKIVLRDGKVGTEEACCCGECPQPYGNFIFAGLASCTPAALGDPFQTEQQAQQAIDFWLAENQNFFDCAILPALEAAGYSRISSGGSGFVYPWCDFCECPYNGLEAPLYGVQVGWTYVYDCGECGSGTLDYDDLECGPVDCALPNATNEFGDNLGGDYPPAFCFPRCNPLP